VSNRNLRQSEFFRPIFAAVIFVASFGCGTAQAISITLDNPERTVVRPEFGTTRVEFTGQVTTDDGFDLSTFSFSGPVTASGQTLHQILPIPTLATSGLLFYFDVAATDVLGFYEFDGFAFPDLLIPVAMIVYECPHAGGGICPRASADYSLNVVATQVPEPETLGLLAIGFLGFIFAPRKHQLFAGTDAEEGEHYRTHRVTTDRSPI